MLSSRLQAAGAHVRAYDPVAEGEARKLIRGVAFEESAMDAVEGADAVVLVTEWPEFAELDLREVAAAMSGNLLVDGRNLFDPARGARRRARLRGHRARRGAHRARRSDVTALRARTRSARSTAPGQMDEVLGAGGAPARRAVARGVLRRAAGRHARRADRRRAWAARRRARGSPSRALGPRLVRAARGLRRLRAARLGGRRRRSSCARATRAPPRRRWRPTTTRSSAARRGWSPRPAGRWSSGRAATACR